MNWNRGVHQKNPGFFLPVLSPICLWFTLLGCMHLVLTTLSKVTAKLGHLEPSLRTTSRKSSKCAAQRGVNGSMTQLQNWFMSKPSLAIRQTPQSPRHPRRLHGLQGHQPSHLNSSGDHGTCANLNILQHILTHPRVTWSDTRVSWPMKARRYC